MILAMAVQGHHTFFSDILRIIIFSFFGLTLGNVAWIIRMYAKAAKRLLPRHILQVSVVFIFALGEAAFQNIVRLGYPFTWYLPFNLALMVVSYTAMRTMRRHLVTLGPDGPLTKNAE